jgi:diguanylate cyclase (GGDEF)-like protein/PAS domain S-box-containing protein
VPEHILLIQQDPADAEAVRDALTDSSDGPFHLEWVGSCAQGLERLVAECKREKPRPLGIAAVLVDLFLPDCQGIETFDQLFLVAPEIPMLVLSGPRDEDIAKLAVQRGAQDYVLKARLDSYVLPKALRSMVERAANAEALFEEKERAQVTLNSIGDAVISVDVRGCVTYLNLVAENMTGWPLAEATGRSIEEVLHVIDVGTREVARNPMILAIRENKAAGLTANCVLVRRDGVEAAIEDSAAPIHDRRGQVTGAVMVFHDVSMARAMSLKMAHLAQHDVLTDLPNRLLFSDRLAQAMTLARRHRKMLAVLFLDLDRFKYINDSLGHDIGDRLLKAVTQRLLSCVRSADTVSRQGGDEFVVLLSEIAHGQDADVCAEKMLSTLAMPYNIDQHVLHVTASIGIATYPDDGTDVDALLKHADFAMYRAKEGGRNSYQFFKPDMNTHVTDRQCLERGLRQAIERNELVLHYQPIVNLQTSQMVGTEALIRWRHPQRGLLPPAEFMPVAEECGFIVSIGQWVRIEACRQAIAWQRAGLPPIRIAVNVSAAELHHRDFVAGVGAILAQSGLEAHYLELELTETSVTRESPSTAMVLQALKDLGVQLALDDFGTGHSSLNHLKRFAIDTLKIDQSFVRNLTTNPADGTIVGAVIGMGLGLNMRIVAEGVETAEQLEFLQGHHCPEAQGYYFEKPVVAADMTRFLGRQAAKVSRALAQARRRSSVERMAGSNAKV